MMEDPTACLVLSPVSFSTLWCVCVCVCVCVYVCVCVCDMCSASHIILAHMPLFCYGD